MQEIDVESELKVIIVGNGQVGKTSMITRYAKGVYTDGYKKTIGTDFMEKQLFVEDKGENVNLMLWDTAGQEMFSELTKSYYRGAGAVVYVFSTVDRDSFLAIDRWRQKVEEQCGSIISVLVQNKIDLLSQATVKSVEVEDLARRMGIKLYRACVKDNLLVDDIFEYIASEFLSKGGQATLADSAVPDITNVDRKPGAGDAEAKSNGGAGGGSGASSGKIGQTGGTSAAFKLQPSKKRTAGKKSFCAIV
eukprot:TRINITY_DN66355_c7_g8_i1.p2 TRINITY_DN66355_c7_g8~~TRINITY_DN66355_c7_g8_i1.p2  ORF type:complete len:267 (-),score=148.35 TRINITY_DN66355_c7_g8_i1:8-754(-)